MGILFMIMNDNIYVLKPDSFMLCGATSLRHSGQSSRLLIPGENCYFASEHFTVILLGREQLHTSSLTDKQLEASDRLAS